MTTNDPDNRAPEFRNEIEHGHDDYTAEELLEQSQLNAQALILGVFDAVKDDPVATSQLTSGIARTFANGWDASRDWAPVEILDALLTNFRSLGGDIDSYEPEEVSPNAVVVGLPDSSLVEQLGVSPLVFRPMLMVSERLVVQLGCELEWSHDATANRIRLQVNARS